MKGRNMPESNGILKSSAKIKILWIQEKFDANSKTFQNILEVAKRWDAAVELTRWDTSEEPANIEEQEDKHITAEETEFDPGSNEVIEILKKEGHAGDCITVYGDFENLRASIQHPEAFSLIVADNLFLSKSHSAQKRMANEFRSAISDAFNVPVVEPDELIRKAPFNFKDKLMLFGKFIAAAAMFLIVFLNQETVLSFLAGDAYKEWRILVIAVVVIFVPAFAYLYATSIKTILKILRID